MFLIKERIRINQITIIEIEENLGISYKEEVSNSSLPIWYAKIRHKKLSELDEGDVIRLIRQDLYLQYVLPLALDLLRDDLFIGKQFDGELVKVLSRVPLNFWANHQDLKKEVNTLILSKKASSESHPWSVIEEKEEFLETLNLLIKHTTT